MPLFTPVRQPSGQWRKKLLAVNNQSDFSVLFCQNTRFEYQLGQILLSGHLDLSYSILMLLMFRKRFEALPIPLNSCRVAFGRNLTLFLAFSTSPICSNASIYRSQKFTDQLCPLDHQPLQLRPREYVSSSFELKRK